MVLISSWHNWEFVRVQKAANLRRNWRGKKGEFQVRRWERDADGGYRGHLTSVLGRLQRHELSSRHLPCFTPRN